MLSRRKHLPGLSLFLIILPLLLTACNSGNPHDVRCEAELPYLRYQGITYYPTTTNALTASDLGRAVTTVGDGASQATSCLLDAGTPLYSVKGYPTTSRLASNSHGHITLFEASQLTASPTTSP